MVEKSYKPFQFKQFSIHQNNAAMKIGTDGILLGAWANTYKSKNIIDIGTGTGVIAIMQCQKNKKAFVDAIEISHQACIDAQNNINNCPWEKRIQLYECNLKKFIPIKKYDHIISNPPFFINSLSPENNERKKARHTEFLSYLDIMNFSLKYLSENGKTSIILPVKEGEKCILSSSKCNLHLTKKCYVKPKAHKNSHRLLLEFSKTKTDCIISHLIIENNERHDYTKEYKEITKNFYTIF
ncbi:MAG: tRNA (adenosine(37)-N6)-methyltransferase TrmM [Crocinitomicaceae bacterium]|nr:tRNA (adenosine(37)-N6)-methyltransferase TrmM [Crocinitomicaceae bacterium]|tara:strand:- start:206 stop:925 length:720 start_codon:yes stop_codon:yes gene_type:complete